MSDRIERVSTIILTIAATVIAAAFVRRELISRPSAAAVANRANQPPRFRQGWNEILEHGVLVGNASAPVKIVEFTDLECPFCREFSRVLHSVRRRHGNAVATWIVHFPLSMHRFARPAARAAECSRDQGRFDEYINAIFEKQDSLGLKSWTSYAKDAAVADTATFSACVTRNDSLPQLDAGIAVGRKFDVVGTPTVFVNGWQYSDPPSEQELDRAVSALLAGKKAFNASR